MLSCHSFRRRLLAEREELLLNSKGDSAGDAEHLRRKNKVLDPASGLGPSSDGRNLLLCTSNRSANAGNLFRFVETLNADLNKRLGSVFSRKIINGAVPFTHGSGDLFTYFGRRPSMGAGNVDPLRTGPKESSKFI